MPSEPSRDFPRTPLPPGPRPGIGALDEMFKELAMAPAIYRPTRFWEDFAEQHLAQLNEDGFENFKRTINQNYFQFQFGSPFHPMARPLWGKWLRRPRLAPMRAHFPEGLELQLGDSRVAKLRSASYARYIALLADTVAEYDEDDLLGRLDEPLVGNPVYVEHRGRRLTEDVANSVLEYSAVSNALPPDRLKGATIIELGSGYGRLAWCWLSARPDCRYVLVDIPPALGVAEQYLAELFPERKIFGFRHFDTQDEVAAELAAAQIAFLTPNQLDLLPDLRADLFINVSSLHEMVPAQIDHYFDVIDAHTDGWFYTKQCIRSINASDDVVIERSRYPVKDRWQTVFDRTHPTNGDFFEALYRLDRARPKTGE